MKTKFPLAKIEKSELLTYFITKPSFLSEESEKRFLDLLKNNKLNIFYDGASKLITSSNDVANLYIYLMNKMEIQGFSNQEIENHVCWRLFNIASTGWLQVYDVDILNYCWKNTTDADLIKEIKKAIKVKWFKEYLHYVNIEKQISYNLSNSEKNISEYYKFISKLNSEHKIDAEQFNEVIEILERETSIYKGEALIGRIISPELQEKLGFRIIIQKIKIITENVKETISNKFNL